MATKVSSKQCRNARDLLKWNVHDLASRVNVAVKRIESFERGSIQLYQNENTEISDVFKKEGIEFLSDFEVKLKKEVKDKNKQQVFAGSVGLGGKFSDGEDGGDNAGGGMDYTLNSERQSLFGAPAEEADLLRSKVAAKKPQS